MRQLSALLLLLPCLAFADIYRCPGANGKLSYSDRPCAGAMESAEQKIEVTPQNITDPLASKKQIAEQEKRAKQLRASSAMSAPTGVQYCRSYSSTSLRTLVVSNTVQPGMPRDAAISAWGAPTAINGGRPEQLVYRWASSTSYIYIVDGCVWRVDGGYAR
ncbi:DUF4124 domain-containing protein [Pseudomonas citronellolis]|uniref:DUF4124 domain-containing protein n=1 Tax=Pseudomonas citronellolis TaxID=53408 RepID=UPI0023E403E2|nr:DUF4124 domain-containing protein [Pseudomonas citronellolis]MDF3932149.1 DUF4124 domain-containing protein [Pseudomonas citronellolis]